MLEAVVARADWSVVVGGFNSWPHDRSGQKLEMRWKQGGAIALKAWHLGACFYNPGFNF